VTDPIRPLWEAIEDLKRGRVTSRSGTVTAVDPVAKTITVDFGADVGEVSGIDVSQQADHFLPDVGDLVTLDLHGATPIYRPRRIGSNAVGYTELDGTVTTDIGEAAATATTALTTANGKNTVVFAPNPPSVNGAKVGDIWWERDGGGLIVGTWEWDGDSWESRKFGDAVFDTITAGKITSGQIAAGVTIIVGDPAGRHVVIDGEKVAALAVTPDGITYEVARLGERSGGADSEGNTTWQIDANGRISGQELSISGDPIIQGVPFSEHTAAYAKFHGGASRGGDVDPANTGGAAEVGFYEITMEFEPGRKYLLQSSNIWIRPTTTATTRIDVNLRYTVTSSRTSDPPAVNLSSPRFLRWPSNVIGTTGQGVVLTKLVGWDTYAHFRFLLTIESFGGAAYIEMGSEVHFNSTLGVNVEPDAAQLYAIDLGLHPWTNRAVLNSGSGTPASVRRYTRLYYPSWTRRFNGAGGVIADARDAVQGYSTYYPSLGDQKSQVGGFTRTGGTTIATDLTGATVEKLELWLYARHWQNENGTAVIRYHTNTTPGTANNFAGLKQVTGWSRGEGRWVDITSWAANFAGTARGIQVGASGSTDTDFYGVFDGHAGTNPPIIRATYTR
jgi:hypothetical protein